MTQWMGNLFFRQQPIHIIRSLRWAEMKEWNEWHEIMVKEEKRQVEEAKKK